MEKSHFTWTSFQGAGHLHYDSSTVSRVVGKTTIRVGEYRLPLRQLAASKRTVTTRLVTTTLTRLASDANIYFRGKWKLP
jgi:hypothetical protein